MSNPNINTRNFVVTGASSFRIDFDVTIGEERISSIAAGGAIDGYDYLMVSDPTGEAREFTFDFSDLKKTIDTYSTVNVIVRIMDVDGHIFEWGFSQNYATENGYPSVSNARISQRSDGSRLIDVEYDYNSPNEIDPATVSVVLSNDWGKTWNVPLTSMIGDVGAHVSVGPNRKVTWNPAIDLPDAGTSPLSAGITIVNSDGLSAVGIRITGTIIISPPESVTPIISIVPSVEGERFSRRYGNLYKNMSIDFDPIESSSMSSLSSMSSSSSSSLSSFSSSLSSMSSSSVSSLSSSSISSLSTQTSVSSASSVSSVSSQSSSSTSISESSISSLSSTSESSVTSVSSFSSLSSRSSFSSLSSSTHEMTTSSSSGDVYYVLAGFGSDGSFGLPDVNGTYFYIGITSGGGKIYEKTLPDLTTMILRKRYSGLYWMVYYSVGAILYVNDSNDPAGGTWVPYDGMSPAGTVTKYNT